LIAERSDASDVPGDAARHKGPIRYVLLDAASLFDAGAHDYVRVNGQRDTTCFMRGRALPCPSRRSSRWIVEQPDACDDHGYMMPNVIRRVLDVFLAFKSPGGGGLFGQLDTLCADYPVLDDLLSFSPMAIEEMREAAGVLFFMMREVDGKRLKGLCR